MLGANYLELKLVRLGIEETDDGAAVKVNLMEADTPVEVEGKGVGVVDALYNALLDRYAREYQSLKSLQLASFSVDADIESKKAQAGVDAVGRVTIDVANSEGRHFCFVNAERAFLTLHNARRDASSRGREDLVARYTAEMAQVVESTSYAEVIENIRKGTL